MIELMGYTVNNGKGPAWIMKFVGENKPLKRYEGLYIGFKDENEHWTIFEIDSKTVLMSRQFGPYCVYEAHFLGYSPDTTVALEKVNFEWVTDEEIIKEAHKRACYT